MPCQVPMNTSRMLSCLEENKQLLLNKCIPLFVHEKPIKDKRSRTRIMLKVWMLQGEQLTRNDQMEKSIDPSQEINLKGSVNDSIVTRRDIWRKTTLKENTLETLKIMKMVY